jgi:hypothetical protein
LFFYFFADMAHVAPTELGISFRGGFYNYAAPLTLEWVPAAVRTRK